MSFTTEERKAMEEAKAQGLSQEQALGILAEMRQPQTQEVQKQALANRVTDFLGLGGATDVFGRHLARAGIGTDVPTEVTKEFVEKPTGLETLGAVTQTAVIPAGAVLTGGTSLTGQILAGAGLGYLYDVGSDLSEGRTDAGVLTPGAETLAGAAIPPVLRGASGAVRGLGTAISKTKGVQAVTQDVAERVPRAISKVDEALETAATRRQRIKSASPEVRAAIKSGVDDVVIEAVEQADDATIAAYREMIEIAESPKTGLRPSVRPESVAGDAVSEQYKILNSQRQAIGQEIGDAVDALTQEGGIVNVLPQQRQLRDLMRQNGITAYADGIDFSGSALTPQQQTKVLELYNIATQSENLTPRQVYNLDKVFSQLQREARFDQLDNIFLQTPDGDVNIFRAFRNVYANKLDEVAPEIAPLNKQYAQLRNLQDDIESSIVKRGNFDSTRDVDAAEFAQTNLRRIFSDAQSAADYRALADKLDEFSRQNGYEGANPQDLAGFANRLRDIYPETVPETSFRGGIRGGIADVVSNVMDIGKPTQIDQQRALKELLEARQPVTSAITPEQGTALQELSKRVNESSGSSVPEYLKDNKQAGFFAGGKIGSTVTPESVAKQMDDATFDAVSVMIDDIQTARTNPDVNRFLDDMKLSNASDEELLKFLKEATDEYERLNPTSLTPSATTKTTDLVEEAKGKSLEEFIKNNFVFHGTNKQFDSFDSNAVKEKGRALGDGTYFTKTERLANSYAGKNPSSKVVYANLNDKNLYNLNHVSVENGEVAFSVPNDLMRVAREQGYKTQKEVVELANNDKNKFNSLVKDAGYDGVEGSDNILVFDASSIKPRTRDELENIWKQANKTDLLEEAKKYDSAEEFVKAQKNIYHGTPEIFDEFDTSKTEGGVVWFTENVSDLVGDSATGAVQKQGQKLNVMDRYLDPNAKIGGYDEKDKFVDTSRLIDEGFDGMYYADDGYYEIFNLDALKTKQELQDIWKQANR